MIKKTVTSIFLLFLLIFTLSFKISKAQNYFDVSLESTYIFSDEGNCFIKDSFEIENNYTEKYLPSFEYTIKNTAVENISVVYGESTLIPIVESDDVSINVKINFDDKVLGKGSKRIFSIQYEIKNLASKTGDVWELSIPKNEDLLLYKNFKTVLIIPQTYGEEAYISPNYSEKQMLENNNIQYVFNKEELQNSRIVIGFGEYQIFDFIINFHLKNTGSFSEKKTISIPPDTSYQRMYYNTLDPKPLNIDVDNDGNWLAKYLVAPKSDLDIKTSGNVQLFANPRKYLTPPIQNLYENIKPTNFWQSNDDAILNLSKSLSDPESIYKYVVENLSYDYSLSRTDRLGAAKALVNKNNSSCREYTDLLIAILRAKGIPAREVIGYAYTDNPSLKPLSFFNDVLHSWVEYWDSSSKIWVSVDPTWGATSKSDYFTKFDLRHFAFTIHGLSDSNPLPAGFYNSDTNEKDIYINFGTLSNSQEVTPEVSNMTGGLYLIKRENVISIKNTNNFALYAKNIKYYFNNNLIYEDNVKIIPPHSTVTKHLKSNFSPLAIKTPSSLTVLINDKSFVFKGPKYTDLFSQLIVIFLFVIILFIRILVKHKRNAK